MNSSQALLFHQGNISFHFNVFVLFRSHTKTGPDGALRIIVHINLNRGVNIFMASNISTLRVGNFNIHLFSMHSFNTFVLGLLRKYSGDYCKYFI